MESALSIIGLIIVICILRSIQGQQKSDILTHQQQIDAHEQTYEQKKKLQDAFFHLKGSNYYKSEARSKLDGEYSTIYDDCRRQISDCETRILVIHVINALLVVAFAFGTLAYKTPAFPFVVMHNIEQEKARKATAEKVARMVNDAEGGDVAAQVSLAQAYRDGALGLPADPIRALKWYKKAYRNGNDAAGYEMAQLLLEGDKKGCATAIAIYQELASKGYADVQYELGNMYFRGEHMKQNETLALEWLTTAAENGHPSAANLIRSIRTKGAEKEGKAFLDKFLQAVETNSGDLPSFFFDDATFVAYPLKGTGGEAIAQAIFAISGATASDRSKFPLARRHLSVEKVEHSGELDSEILVIAFYTAATHSSETAPSSERKSEISLVLQKDGKMCKIKRISVSQPGSFHRSTEAYYDDDYN